MHNLSVSDNPETETIFLAGAAKVDIFRRNMSLRTEGTKPGGPGAVLWSRAPKAY